ncbi:hypothetical protein IJH33_01320 [Candidatus Saccharibacteria bacterium]|nr:hypothetical protein [Candidatus Saccharibacteria bacterium]
MGFLEKLTDNPYQDLLWNVPEQKQGVVNVVGGNGQSFRTVVVTAEFLTGAYPLKEVRVTVPDALSGKLPPVPGVSFLSSTESGSFANEEELEASFGSAEWNLVVGDLSKNAITARAVREALARAERPVVLTRDTVDLVAEPGVDRLLANDKLVVFGSLVQLSKLLHAAYYPKVLMASQSLVQVAEALHKFTLSYPARVVTLHDGQILVCAEGRVVAFSLELTGYSPFMLWSGECAARIVAMNLFCPGKFVEATVCGILAEKKAPA